MSSSCRKERPASRCPLCLCKQTQVHCRSREKVWEHCPLCDLVFVPDAYRLSPEEEKARYDLHQNDPEDAGYRDFLNRLLSPLRKKLREGAAGLDYGGGPGPALSVMLREAGFFCENYDPFYADDPALLEKRYDFLVCTETAEHFYRPDEEFERIFRMVKPGGWIGIMTQFYDSAPVPFEKWFYKDDPTHVCFYSKKTFEWIGEKYGISPEFHSSGVVLFRCLSVADTALFDR